MTNITVLETKISHVQKYLTLVAKYNDLKLEEIVSSTMMCSAFERQLQLLFQSVIDLAEIVIAFRNLRKPATYKEFFDVLQENSVIDSGLAAELKLMVGQRNIIVHEYEGLNYEMLYLTVSEKLPVIEGFVEAVKKV